MDASVAFSYWKALKAIRANQQKSQIEVAVYPHLKEDRDRDKVQRGLSQAFKQNVTDGDYVKERELEEILRRRRTSE